MFTSRRPCRDAASGVPCGAVGPTARDARPPQIGGGIARRERFEHIDRFASCFFSTCSYQHLYAHTHSRTI